jgi:hypothetical protein
MALIMNAVHAGGVQPPEPDRFSQVMRTKIAEAQSANRMTYRGELVCGIAELPRFYAWWDYRPAWLDGSGSFAPANDLIHSIDADGSGSPACSSAYAKPQCAAF